MREGDPQPGQAVPRTNWSGNYRYSTDRVLQPATVDEVQAAVRSSDRVHALGTRHAFNGSADTRGVQISTRRLCDVKIDAAAGTVRVGAGMRYGELAVILDAAGFALHNMASLPHISVGGAVATGTHGSGLGNGNLATAVTALQWVDGTGEVRRIARGADPEFAGAVVALGALGIVTHLTLRIEPRFNMVQRVYEGLPFRELRDGLEEVMGAAYSVSLFTDWQDGRVRQAWVKRRVVAGQAQEAAPASFFGAKLARTKLHPLPEQSAEACTEQTEGVGAWFERLPHFQLAFQPSFGEELQSEYFVPFERGYEAICAVETLRERIGPLLYVCEFRAIATDDLWMSGQYGRRSLGLHFTWRREWDAVLAVLSEIEAVLAPFAARPHWGKVFNLRGEQMRGLYPRWSDFRALRERFDPGNRFENAYLQDVFEKA